MTSAAASRPCAEQRSRCDGVAPGCSDRRRGDDGCSGAALGGGSAVAADSDHRHAHSPVRSDTPAGRAVQRAAAHARRCADRRISRSLSKARGPARRRRRDQGRGEPVDRRQLVGTRGRPTRRDHGWRRRQPRARQAGVSRVSRPLPQEPALPRHSLWELVGARHHQTVHQSELHRRPAPARRRRSRARHREPARAAARGDAAHQRRRADASHRARSPAGARSDRHGARGL